MGKPNFIFCKEFPPFIDLFPHSASLRGRILAEKFVQNTSDIEPVPPVFVLVKKSYKYNYKLSLVLALVKNVKKCLYKNTCKKK